MAYFLFIFRRFGVKEPRRSKNNSTHEKCHLYHRSTRLYWYHTYMQIIHECTRKHQQQNTHIAIKPHAVRHSKGLEQSSTSTNSISNSRQASKREDLFSPFPRNVLSSCDDAVLRCSADSSSAKHYTWGKKYVCSHRNYSAC